VCEGQNDPISQFDEIVAMGPGQNFTGQNFTGQNFTGHNFTGQNFTGHNFTAIF
jgi:uncharacterized protein YjbI with pentapeptide repeats